MTAFTMNQKWFDATWYGTEFSKTRRGYPDTKGWNLPCYDDADPDGGDDVPTDVGSPSSKSKTDAEIMAKAEISSSVDKGFSAAQHAHSKMTMPFTPAGAWKHVTEVLKLDLPKEEIEAFDSFWTVSINFAALESWAKGWTAAPDGNNSGMYNLMYLWIEMADTAQNGTLCEFPSTEYAAWGATDKLTALSARRFAVHALHSM